MKIIVNLLAVTLLLTLLFGCGGSNGQSPFAGAFQGTAESNHPDFVDADVSVTVQISNEGSVVGTGTLPFAESAVVEGQILENGYLVMTVTANPPDSGSMHFEGTAEISGNVISGTISRLGGDFEVPYELVLTRE